MSMLRLRFSHGCSSGFGDCGSGWQGAPAAGAGCRLLALATTISVATCAPTIGPAEGRGPCPNPLGPTTSRLCGRGQGVAAGRRKGEPDGIEQRGSVADGAQCRQANQGKAEKKRGELHD